MYLYHYYDKRSGPFKSLTALSETEALSVLEKIKSERPESFTAQRDAEYITKRMNCERIVRREAENKGILMDIPSPHYLVVEDSPWLSTWIEDPGVIKIPIEEFDTRKISFTYGDSMPTFSPRVNDGKEYRRKVYTYEEILDVISRYGLPQEWNNDGSKGPERYIEAQVWTDEPVMSIKAY
ncbi:MAG: hypothetical protein J5777_08355 [Clostridiales bacterium]|nr:hypothetical protein [Clostridiales bacterium]